MTIDPDKVDAAPTTVFVLTQGIAAKLPGNRLTTFRAPEDMVRKVDPSGKWLEQAGPDGAGDTLKEFCTHLDNSLSTMGLVLRLTPKPTHVTFDSSSAEAELQATNKLRKDLEAMSSPPDGIHKIMVVNCDQALAINGATGSQYEQGDHGGNYCIVAKFDPKTDKVLLFDLDKSYSDGDPPKGSGSYWVPVSNLAGAMNTLDTDAGVNRGYTSFSFATY